MTGPEVDRVPSYTAPEMAAAAGISEFEARRFFRALGFPDAGDEVRYTQEDLRVLKSVVESMADSEVDLATAVRLVRAIGQSVARMSDWQVTALTRLAEERGATEATKREITQGLTDEVVDAMELVLTHAWRRHLGAALNRLDVGPDAQEVDQTYLVTVGFADLVNFSALSNELDPDRLGELVEIFEARCGDVVAAYEGRMVKTIGDAVLFVVDRPDRAMNIACGLIDVIGDDSRLPDVRIGLSTGLVITRLGDIFGPPVNLAARLTSLARRNRVIVDQATAARLPARDFDLRPLTARPLRGFGLVSPVAVRRN